VIESIRAHRIEGVARCEKGRKSGLCTEIGFYTSNRASNPKSTLLIGLRQHRGGDHFGAAAVLVPGRRLRALLCIFHRPSSGGAINHLFHERFPPKIPRSVPPPIGVVGQNGKAAIPNKKPKREQVVKNGNVAKLVEEASLMWILHDVLLARLIVLL